MHVGNVMMLFFLSNNNYNVRLARTHVNNDLYLLSKMHPYVRMFCLGGLGCVR